MYKILVADDEKGYCDLLEKAINRMEGFHVVGKAYDGELAAKLVEQLHPDILITDIEMADLSGLELLEWIRDSGQKILTIFCTAFRSFDYAKKAIELHAFDYFLKPVRYGELTEKLAQATRALGASQELPPMGPDAPEEAPPAGNRRVRTGRDFTGSGLPSGVVCSTADCSFPWRCP